MPNIPTVTTTISPVAGAPASGTDLVCVMSPCASNADHEPRVFGNASDVYDFHDYCEGVEYVALHAQKTRRGVLFVGLPIATLGVVSRENTSGNTGTSVSSLAAGGDGVLGEHEGVLTVIQGGTIGTDQIILGLSLDNGRTTQRVRLGTANSYAIPYVNVTVSFAAGTLVAGDTIHTWFGSAPRSNAAAWATARANLAAQSKIFRSVILCGDLQNSTESDAWATQWNAYETANTRFTVALASLRDRLPLASLSSTTWRMTGNPTLTFAEVGATGDTITRSAGSWLADGAVVGDTFTVTGTASNDGTYVIDSLSATVITLDTEDLADEVVAGVTVTGSPTITFAEVGATGDTITRSRGSWLDDGLRVGDNFTVAGSVSNNTTTVAGIDSLSATVITLDTDDLAAESVRADAITLVAGQTKAVWMADLDSSFAATDAEKRVDLGAGRGRVLSAFSDWWFRRPVSWAESLRMYQHDIHVAPWRKDLGPTDFDLFDDDQNLVEWDDRVDGGAGSLARFTTFRTWSNGPQGAFITLALTRATDGSVFQYTHNMTVVNLAQATVQYYGENAVGRSLVLKQDGTGNAEPDALSLIEGEVNAALKLALLKNTRGEGQRASKAVWTAATDDDLRPIGATLNGVLELGLNGTVHSVATVIRVQ